MRLFVKRFVTMFAAAAMIMTQLVCVHAETDGYTLSYSINPDGTSVSVTGFETAPSGNYDLFIPRKVTIDGKSYIVTDIADGEISGGDCPRSIFGGSRKNGVTNNNASLKSVTFPNTLKRIGDGAFFACTGLTRLDFPDSLEEIGVQAFRFANNIQTYGILPPSLKKIDSWAFGDVAAMKGVISTPANISLGEKFLQSAVRGSGHGETAALIPGEGITVMPGIYRSSYIDTLVVPHSIKTGERSYFTNNELQWLREVYILNENFAFNNTGMITVGGKLEGKKTHWYVASQSVADKLIACSLSEEDITVLDSNVVALVENEDTYSIETCENGSIVLPEPQKDGYAFKYWTDGTGNYSAGDVYNAQHSVVMTPVYEKLDIRSTICLRSVASDSETAETGNAPIYKIVSDSLGGATAEVILTDENGFTESFEAYFDDNGVWVNKFNDSSYTSATVSGCTDYSAFCITNGGFEVIMPLKSPQTILYPTVNGVSELSEFSWSSSDVTVARVSDGVVTGVKSGTAVISAERDGERYEFTVIVKGEIALARENGTENEYMAEKKPITDAISAAIKSGDKPAFLEILSGSGSAKLADIKDIDTEDINNADESYLDEFADRMLTYKDFEFKNIDSISEFGDILAKEFAVGRLNHLSDVSGVENVINTNNPYYALATDNKYYKNYKEEILGKFVNYTAKNLAGVREDFVKAYVAAAIKNAPVYNSLETVFADLESEIGYNKTHYNENKCSDMYVTVINNTDKYSDIDELRKFIDSYTKKEDSGSGSTDGNSGSGSSGGRGSSGSGGGFSYSPGDAEKPPVVKQDRTQLFSDIANDRWSHDAIAYLVAKNALSGYSDGSFRPQQAVSRAEFAKIVASAFDYKRQTEPSADGEENSDAEPSATFADVSDGDWFAPYVLGLADAKIVSGDNNGAFNPNVGITRQEAAVILYRVLYGKNISDTAETGTMTVGDVGEIAEWAYTPVMQLIRSGIISGYSDGTFRPNGNITREETSKMIYELLYKLNGGN